MQVAWFRLSVLRMIALLGGLLLVLSGCHLHHRGHGYNGGGHHGGGYYKGGDRGHHGGDRYRYKDRGHGGGHHRGGGWRGRY